MAPSRRRRTGYHSRKRSAPEPGPSSTKVPSAVPGSLPRSRILFTVAVVAVIVFAGGMSWRWFTEGKAPWVSPPGEAVASAKFVDSEICAACHQAEAQLWRSSQHKLAMDHATDKSVLGDFHDASFEYYGVHSRFFRKDGKLFVETDGADGKLATFQVKYTFSIDPLQQYLIEFLDGRLQALSIA